MEVQFREFNPFDLWIWLEFETVPAPMEKQYLEEVFNSWFYLGKLGGFNAENLQVNDTGIEISYMEYDPKLAGDALMAPMHNMSDFEYSGVWGRCWFDLGTSDLIALDVLINAIHQLSREYVTIKKIVFGGQNEEWQVESRQDNLFYDSNLN